MKKKIVAAALVCVFTLVNFSEFANAQALMGDPGAQGGISRDQLRERQFEERFIEPVRSTADREEAFEIEFTKTPEAAEIKTEEPTFIVTKINFKGNSVMSESMLQKLSSYIEGTEVNISDIKIFVINVSRFFQQEGYLTSYASLPMQLINKGIVTVYIHESPIKNLSFEGGKWVRPWYLENILFNRKGLRPGDVFNARPLQSVLKEINNDYDYLKAQVRLRREDDDSTSLTVDIFDRFPVKLNLNVDNYGRDNSGREQLTAILGSQNLTGFGDRIYAGGILSTYSYGLVAGYSVPASAYGTRLNYDFAYNSSDIAASDNLLQIEGRSTIHSINVSQPIIRDANTDLIARAGMDFINTNSEIPLFNMTLSEYNLRVFRANLSFLNDDDKGRWIMNGGLGIGIDGLGAKGISGTYEKEFVKLNAMAARVQRFPVLDTIGIFRLAGQYTPNKLYPVEQMQIGGPFSVRGYQPAELLGDNGLSGTIEFRFPIPGLKQLAQRRLFSDIYENIKIAPFYDFGYVSSNIPGFDYPNNFLQSAGISLYAYPFKYLSINLGVGFPLGKKAYNEDTARFYFAINTEFDKLLTPKKHSK
ncbi:MAG: hypothetical protein FWF00_04190 [Endomicrobia bacterium]|nr:hypothetical protein [Endomicrobiia bacterium]MCL2506870.1 hypothetical protein [Endomicrobiia bacterium]